MRVYMHMITKGTFDSYGDWDTCLANEGDKLNPKNVRDENPENLQYITHSMGEVVYYNKIIGVYQIEL